MSNARVDEAESQGHGLQPARAGRRWKWSRVAFLAILGLAIGNACIYYELANRGAVSSRDATVGCEQIVVRSAISGQIARLGKEPRDTVSLGDVLVALDDTSFENEEREAQADMDLAVQSLALAQSRLDAATSDLQEAAAQLQDKIVPQQQYDRVASAKATAQIQISIAKVLSDLARTRATEAQASLDRTVIKSPISGVVARKWVAVGDTVLPGQALYTLYNTNNLWVDAYFTDRQVKRISVGNSVAVMVDAFPGMTFTGTVKSVGTGTPVDSALEISDLATGIFTRVTPRGQVTITLDNPDSWNMGPGKALLPGMPAAVRVRTDGR